MVIRAIETRYNGYMFRSRLEARWAVFFDSLAMHYEYEMEGFIVGKGEWYLPDFWLPDLGLWVETKPYETDPITVPQRLSDLVVISGLPWRYRTYQDGWLADMGEWGECECGAINFGYRCAGEVEGPQACGCPSDVKGRGRNAQHDTRSPKILSAQATAKSARF